jgi:hypothetical protein
MDPVTIIGLVASLVPMCAKVGKALSDVRSKYNNASMTLSSIASECSVIATALSQIEQVAIKDPRGLSSRLDASGSQLGASFELALNGCGLALSVLSEEVGKMEGSGGVRILGWKSKAKFVWNEEGMKDLLGNLRGQNGALHLLVTALQTYVFSLVPFHRS